jgi:glycerol-3-phosphate dehydrogenase
MRMYSLSYTVQGVEVEGDRISTFPTVISSVLGIPCSALSGANIANEGSRPLDTHPLLVLKHFV